jgi:hypothetical protein
VFFEIHRANHRSGKESEAIAHLVPESRRTSRWMPDHPHVCHQAKMAFRLTGPVHIGDRVRAPFQRRFNYDAAEMRTLLKADSDRPQQLNFAGAARRPAAVTLKPAV